MKEYSERDLNISAFLLTNPKIKFIRAFLAPNNKTVFLCFQPYDLAFKMAGSYYSDNEPNVNVKTLLDALDTARSIIFRTKEQVNISDGMKKKDVY